MATLTTAIGRFLCLLAITFLGAGVALAYELPPIPGSGSPAFYNRVKVDLNPNSGRLKLSGKKDFMFENSGQFYQGTNGKYTLLVNFDKDTGMFQGGSLELRGAIAELGIPKNETLVTADITGWNLEGTQSGAPLLGGGFNLWGFATDNIICSPLLLITCTVRESVYVVLDEAFSGLPISGRFRTTGYAQTTVPLPAAAWLLGSALGLLGWLRHVKKQTAGSRAD
jgi:hypothetical protein